LNKLKVIVAGVLATILVAALLIVHIYGLETFVRIILGIGFLGLTLFFGFFLAIAVYAESWRPAAYLLIPVVLSAYSTSLCVTWHKLELIGGIIALFVLGLVGFVWYVSEPVLGLVDRFKSAESLEREGKYEAAARKFEKRGDFKNAAEMYLKLGWFESAAWAYGKAGDFGKSAELYEKLYEQEGDSYYLKEAREFWRKKGDVKRVARCFEKYAEEEPWFWEDVAEMYEELNNQEKARESWKRALEYYLGEAKEEGVFWDDVGKIYEKLGKHKASREAYNRFLEYCLNEAERDSMWWKHVAETYEVLGEHEKAEKAWDIYERYRGSLIIDEEWWDK